MAKLCLILACALMGACAMFGKSGGGSKTPPPTAGMLSPEAELSMPPAASAVYELYSWSDERGWHYSLFKMSDAPKNFAAITASQDVLAGEQQLLDRMKSVSRGSQIYWNFRNINGFSLPDEETQKRIYAAARAVSASMDIIRR